MPNLLQLFRRPPMTDKELEIAVAAHEMQRLELKDDEVLE